MRIDTLKEKRLKKRISSFKKIKPDMENRFVATLYRVVGNKKQYQLFKSEGKDTSRGSISGNLFASIVETKQRNYTDKHVSFEYQKLTGKIIITFYKGFQSGQYETKVRKHTISVYEIKTHNIGKWVRYWFESQKYHGFMLKVSFRTVFPGFESYSKIFHTDSIGAGIASEIIEDIMHKCIKPVSKKTSKETERLHHAFVSAKHLGEEVFYCKVMDLESEKVLPSAENMMIAELGNQLYKKITPAPVVLTQKDKVHEYFSTVFEFMRKFFREINPFNWIKI